MDQKLKFVASVGLLPEIQDRPRQQKSFFMDSSALARKWSEGLRLPLFTTEQRKTFSAADIPGLQQLMLALEGTFTRLGGLALVMGVNSPIIVNLRAKDVRLYEITRVSTLLADRCQEAQRYAIREIRELTERARGTAARLLLQAPPDSDAHRQLTAFVAAVDSFNGRLQRKKKQKAARRKRSTADLATQVEARRLAGHILQPAASLLAGTGGAAPPATQGAAVPRRRAGADPGLDRTPPPAQQILDAPLDDFAACQAALAGLLAALGAPSGEAPEDVQDYLLYGDLGALVAAALDESPLLAQAAGVTGAQLELLCDERSGAASLQQETTALAQAALDGHFFQAAFVLYLYEQVQEWARRQLADPQTLPDDRRRIEVEVANLAEVMRRARERVTAHADQTQKDRDALQDTLRGLDADANLAAVKDRLARGEQVSAEEYYAAESRQRELHGQAQKDALDAMRRGQPRPKAPQGPTRTAPSAAPRPAPLARKPRSRPRRST